MPVKRWSTTVHREAVAGVHRRDEPVAQRLVALELLLRVGGRVVAAPAAHSDRIARADRAEIRVRGEVVGIRVHQRNHRAIGTTTTEPTGRERNYAVPSRAGRLPAVAAGGVLGILVEPGDHLVAEQR